MKVCAIILAAGLSTRMGDLKPLVQIRGRTFLEWVLVNVLASEVDDVVLVLGHQAETVRGFVFSNRVRVVLNEHYRDGMASSIQAGLGNIAGADAALVVLADQPLVQAETMNRLLAAYRERHPRIVVPEFAGRRGNPVVIDRTLFPDLMALRGDVGARAVFEKYAAETVRVDVPDRGVILDFDRPEDVEDSLTS